MSFGSGRSCFSGRGAPFSSLVTVALLSFGRVCAFREKVLSFSLAACTLS